jgi:predicted nuclease of predicted toxin-antitoxin system
VRLLLDEHYSPKIAEELRKRGHDVVSLGERRDVRGLDDRELWNRASAEKRAVLTENVADFMALVREAAAGDEPHFGVIFTSPRSLPRGAGTIGVYVELLDRLLRDRPSDDALMDQVYWLGPN